MPAFATLSLDEAISSLSRRPGIVIGPRATRAPDALGQVIRQVLKEQGLESLWNNEDGEDQYRALLDQLNESSPEKAARVQEALREDIRRLRPVLDLPILARAGWSACISLTEDLLFEAELRTYLDSIPSSKAMCTIDHPTVVPPDRTVPIYKLLGNLNNSAPEHTLALSESSFLARQQLWRSLLQTCPDFLHDAPILFVGGVGALPLVRTVVSTLLGMPRPNVAGMLFLRDDPTKDDATIRSLCRDVKTQVIDGTLRDFCAAVAELKPKKTLRFGVAREAKSDTVLGLVAANQGIVSIVPASKPANYDPMRHLPEVIDGLFRPASIDWTPFLFDFDLRRTATDALKNSITESLKARSTYHLPWIVLRGEAAIGKTTLLKRTAIELARGGITALWCRRAQSDGWIRTYRTFARDLAQTITEKNLDVPIVLFCDDPWALKLDAGEILSCFERFPGRIVFVFSSRNTDYLTGEGSPLAIGAKPTDEIELPFQLDSTELPALAGMLMRIGAVRSKEEAHKEIARVPSRNANDILCSLWYLIPETRSQLSDSLRDEYWRLGEVHESVVGLAHQASVTNVVARHAYEYVTVTSNLGVGLPVEILVRALRVNYDEWIGMMSGGRPLWGLLYDDEDGDLEEKFLVYRTRNEVVTKVLLELVNGGVGHAGEVRVLQHLIKACDVGAPVYRKFVLDVLVRARTKLEKILTYGQGVELYDLARQTLPYADRVLEHHKGIWMSDVGHEYRDAYAQMELALQSPVYPGAERDAPQEHIHTSMAASVVRMVKAGTQSRESGLALVREHLRQASGPMFLNPHTAHVSANLLFELGQQGSDDNPDSLSLTSFADALQEIERALQKIGAHGREHFRFQKSIALLSELQRRILRAIPDLTVLRVLAERAFENSRSQAGFEVVARRMLSEATESGKGRAFNEVKNYLDECVTKIQGRRVELAPEIFIVRTDLTIRWRVQRPGSPVDWAPFRQDLEQILQSPRYRDDVIKMFYLAVALYHQGELTDANARFASLRRLQPLALMPREVRCYYIDKQGNPQRFQGTVLKEHGRFYVSVPELNCSLPAHTTLGEGAGATTHIYIGFSLNGPVAVFHKPDTQAFMLP
jgi:hypothetical protein